MSRGSNKSHRAYSCFSSHSHALIFFAPCYLNMLSFAAYFRADKTCTLTHTSTRFYSSNKAEDRWRRPEVSGLSIKVITACCSSSQHCIRRKKKRRRRNNWSVAFEYDPLPRSLNWCRQCACVGESLAEDACSYYSMLPRESGLSQV